MTSQKFPTKREKEVIKGEEKYQIFQGSNRKAFRAQAIVQKMQSNDKTEKHTQTHTFTCIYRKLKN